MVSRSWSPVLGLPLVVSRSWSPARDLPLVVSRSWTLARGLPARGLPARGLPLVVLVSLPTLLHRVFRDRLASGIHGDALHPVETQALGNLERGPI